MGRFLSNMTSRPISFAVPVLTAAMLCSCDQDPKLAASAPAAKTAEPVAAAAADTISPAGPARISRGPYPQAASADSMHMIWRVRQKTQPAVRYGLSPSELTSSTKDSDIKIRRLPSEWKHSGDVKPLHSAPAETRQYEAHITGLKPDTLYYYAVYDGESRLTPESADYSFRTLPTPGTERPLLLWVVGDSGTGNKVQAKVHTAFRDWLTREKRTVDAYIHVGDMAYNSGMDSEFQGYFFQTYADTLRNTVCWPAFGNHEGRTSKGATATGPYFDAYITPTAGESGGVPSGTEGYYSFDYGRVHFISLNSYDISRSPDGAMAQWLKADLEKAKGDWIIAFFHHPPYTKGSHDSDDPKKDKELIEMRENIMPILEAGGVDLVLAGHSHIYERSMLIDGAYATPTVSENVVYQDGDGDPASGGAYKKSAGLKPNQGTVSIVAGHGGASLGHKKLASPVMRVSLLEFGSLLLDLKGDTLTGHMLNADGAMRDTFQLIKRGEVVQQRIAKPWAPPPFSGPEKIAVPGPGSEGSKSPESEKSFPLLPPQFTEIIPKNDTWEYLAGEKPDTNWTTTLGSWKKGAAGFGYGDGDDVTKFEDMQGKYQYLCIRREFEIKEGTDVSKLGLAVAYDDGFICYINGQEVARTNVTGSLDSAGKVRNHEADRKFEHFPFTNAKDIVKTGKNIIAIEIHNDELKSSDLSLNPFLILSGASSGSADKNEAPDD
jgi:acid phosphatase type 7